MRPPGSAGGAVEATMSMQRPEERIAQLLANAEVQRLAAELAIYEAREQLAPLRSAAGVLGVAARALAPRGAAAGSVIGAVARFFVGHPWLGSALAAGAMRLLRRRPIALLLAGATAAAAWWFLRPAPGPADKMKRPG